MEGPFSLLRDVVEDLWTTLGGREVEQSLLPLLHPVPPYRVSGILGSLSTMAALLALAVLTGVSIGALGVLALAALGVHLLLTEVFGITIEFRPPSL